MPAKPTGARPTPKVPKPVSGKTARMNTTKPAVKHTKMGAPKAMSTMKKKGGRGY